MLKDKLQARDLRWWLNQRNQRFRQYEFDQFFPPAPNRTISDSFSCPRVGCLPLNRSIRECGISCIEYRFVVYFKFPNEAQYKSVKNDKPRLISALFMVADVKKCPKNAQGSRKELMRKLFSVPIRYLDRTIYLSCLQFKLIHYSLNKGWRTISEKDYH